MNRPLPILSINPAGPPKPSGTLLLAEPARGDEASLPQRKFG
jgi:hypothetical protein